MKKRRTVEKVSSNAKTGGTESSFFLRTRLHAVLLFLLGIGLYANTLTHDFILDDALVITQNALTKKGIVGIPDIFLSDSPLSNETNPKSTEIVTGGRYRPVSLAMFAVIYQVAGNSPMPYHIVSVLLFGLTCVAFYKVVLQTFAHYENTAILAWVAAVLFAVHPIHTEVVNNIKSCDEILALLFSLLALLMALKAHAMRRSKWIWLSSLCFLIAIFSKENAVAFLLAIPVALFLKTSLDPTGKTNIWSVINKICLPLCGVFVFFLVVRSAVIPFSFGDEKMNLINNPFVKWNGENWISFDTGEKFATILYTLGKYLLLMVFPHPLTSDYYPRHISIHHFGEPVIWFSLLVNAGLFLYAVIGLFKGHRDPIRYGILLYFCSLFIVSNIPFPIGTNMAERFIFMPSAGLCLAISALSCQFLIFSPTRRVGFFVIFTAICIAATIKTFLRNQDYASNISLFRADIKVSENSAKMQYGYSALMITEAMKAENPAKRIELLNESVLHASKALEIHPTYPEAFYSRGSAHFIKGEYDLAISDFEKSLTLVPGRPEVLNNLAAATLEAGKLLFNQKDFEKAKLYLEYSNRIYPNNVETLRYLELAKQNTQQ